MRLKFVLCGSEFRLSYWEVSAIEVSQAQSPFLLTPLLGARFFSPSERHGTHPLTPIFILFTNSPETQSTELLMWRAEPSYQQHWVNSEK